MFERCLKRRWPKVEAEFAATGDLAEFLEVWDGPTLTRNAQRMPRDRLEQYLQEGVSEHVRSVIERELARRSANRGGLFSLALSGISVIISVIVLWLVW
jgi:hypothetical protein